MDVLTDDTEIKLWCCTEAIKAALDSGKTLDAGSLRLCLKAMEEAAEMLRKLSPKNDRSRL